MNVKRMTSVAASVLVLPLAACGAQSSESSGGDGFTDGVRLSVPDAADNSSLAVVVEQAGFDTGDEVSIYAYRTPFEETEPNCQGDAKPVGKLSVSSDGVESVEATLPDGPGRYWWQVIAPGYTSDCGAASTLYRAVPELGLTQEGNSDMGLNGTGNEGEVGKPYEFAVSVYNEPPTGEVWEVDVEWFGPFESTPEAVAAGCGDDAPVGANTTVKVDKQGDHDTKITPEEPGVYRIVAHTEETKHTGAAATGCDDYSPFVVVK